VCVLKKKTDTLMDEKLFVFLMLEFSLLNFRTKIEIRMISFLFILFCNLYTLSHTLSISVSIYAEHR